MVTKTSQLKQQQLVQLQTQLVVTAANPVIQNDERLRRLVQCAMRQLRRSHDVAAVAYQIAIALGYYLFDHQYGLPQAALDLLAVAQSIDANRWHSGAVVGLPVSE